MLGRKFGKIIYGGDKYLILNNSLVCDVLVEYCLRCFKGSGIGWECFE